MSQPMPTPGDFFVSRSNSGTLLKRILPALVRWITSSKWNHAGVYVGSGQVIEAQPGGVRYWDVKDYLGPDTLWSKGKFLAIDRGFLHPPYDMNLEVAERGDIVDAARSLLGRKYGLLDCIALGFAQVRLGSRADVKKALADQPWWVRQLMSEETVICSQLVDMAYQEADVHLFNDQRLPDWVSPGDLGNLLEAEES